MTGPQFTPSAVRDLQRNMSDWWMSEQAAAYATDQKQFREENADPDDRTGYFRSIDPAAERRRFLAAEAFLVTDDMAAVCRHAADSLPEVTFRHDLLPAEIGMIVFNDRPPASGDAANLRDVPLETLTWYPTVHNGEAGIAINTYIRPALAAQVIDRLHEVRIAKVEATEHQRIVRGEIEILERLRQAAEAGNRAAVEARKIELAEYKRTARPDPELIAREAEEAEWYRRRSQEALDRFRFPAMPALAGFLPYGDVVPETFADTDMADPARMLLAAFLLMDQPISETERPPIDRATARRTARAGITSDLTVILLRRPRRTSTGTGDSDREYHTRWLVHGHWHKYWTGPGRTILRPVYISDYTKGPEGAPLVIRDRVTVLAK